jgi:hypothetical protein
MKPTEKVYDEASINNYPAPLLLAHFKTVISFWRKNKIETIWKQNARQNSVMWQIKQ